MGSANGGQNVQTNPANGQAYQSMNFGGGAPTGASGFQQPQPSYGGTHNTNPWLDTTFNRAADSVEGRMRGSTRFQGLSNSGVQQQYNRNLNDLAGNIYGGAFEGEANRRLQAGTNISNLQASQRNQDLNRQLQATLATPDMLNRSTQYGLGIGDVYRGQDQANINEAIRAYEQQRQYPYQQLDVLGRAIGASMGSGGTTTQTAPGPHQPNSTAGLLGGGLAAAGLLSSLF